MVNRRRLVTRYGEWLTLVAFSCWLYLPLVGSLGGAESSMAPPTRSASLPEFPKSIRSALRWPGKFKYYLENNFVFRDSLIEANGRLKVLGLNVSSSRIVMLGKGGWLFLASDQVVPYQRHIKPCEPQLIHEVHKILFARHDQLDSRGIVYRFAIAPNKHSIYCQFLPDWMTSVNPRSRYDLLLEEMSRSDRGDWFIDLKRPLLDSANRHRVYHKTDTHWNKLGAFVAVEQLVNSLPPELGLPPAKSEDQYAFRVSVEDGGDLARNLGLKFVMRETAFELVPSINAQSPIVGRSQQVQLQSDTIARSTDLFVNEDVTRGTAVFVHDSFGVPMIPLLSQHFHRLFTVWSDELPMDLIASVQPDVVIQEIVERKLMRNWGSL